MPDFHPAHTTDEELFREIATSGHLGAWKMLYDRYSGPLGGYALKILRLGSCYDPNEHVRDARQEAWLRIARSIQQCTGSPAGWLYKIVENACRDHLRGCRREMAGNRQWPDSPAAEERLLPPHRRLYSHEELFLRQLALTHALSHLSPDDQLIIRLRREELSYEEISRIIGHSADYARKLFQRATQRLRRIIAEGVK